MERAVTDYVKTHQGAINFDVVHIFPAWTFGVGNLLTTHLH